MQGTVSAIKRNQKGNLYAVIDGSTYYAGKVDISRLQPGDVIKFEATQFGTNQKTGDPLKGLDNYELLRPGNRFEDRGPQKADPTVGLPLGTEPVMSESERIWVSAILKSAIEAGQIKDMTADMLPWGRAALVTLATLNREAKKLRLSFETDIP